MTGTVASKMEKGFGFIKPDDGSKDVFFHATSVVDGGFDDLQPGDKVSFEVEQGQKGLAAKDVRRI